MRTAFVILGVMVLALLAAAVRSLGFEFVLMDGEVIFPPADAQYHLRRALYTFENFPGVLLFDPYINFPGGASVPWPPLFDFALGATASFVADDVSGFERVAAFAGPACAALAVIPIYLAGTHLGSRSIGFAAAFFFVWLPVVVNYSRVGNADHHAAVSMIGAWLLYAGMVLADARAPFGRLLRFMALLFVARTVLLLTWHGSLLYVGLTDGLILAVGVLSGRRALLALQAASVLATLAVVLPVVLISPEPLGGLYSSIALSWLDVLALLGVVWVALLLVGWRPRGTNAGPLGRVGMAAGAALIFGALVWSFPGPREGLSLALGFLTLADGVGAVTAEQSPLFTMSGRVSLRPAELSWGLFAYLIPFAPLAAGWAALRLQASSANRAAAAFLGAWGLVFALLTLGQRRYGNDFAPAAALLFGFASVALLEWLTRGIPSREWRRATAGIAALLLIGLGFWLPLRGIYWPRAVGSWSVLSAAGNAQFDPRRSIAGTLHHFVRDVRERTPETSGYLDDHSVPEYGIIAPANLGHAIQYGARRATATDPFWWYIGPANWQRSAEFHAATDESAALESAKALQARYVITSAEAAPGSVARRLHESDGVARAGRPALGHFRLVTESEAGGLGLEALFQAPSPGGTAYKLFEIVEGARLEVKADPGTRVGVALPVRTPQGREFTYRTQVRAGPEGRATLRLPYATAGSIRARGGDTPNRGPLVYRVRVGERVQGLQVREEDVLGGRVLRLEEESGS